MAQGSGEVGATSDEIRSQIEHTCGEMSDTIDAIQSRLSPKRVLADAKDSMTEATVARMKRLTNASRGEVWHRMQDNPLPSRSWPQPPPVARAIVDLSGPPAATPRFGNAR